MKNDGNKTESEILVYNFGDYLIHSKKECRKYFVRKLSGGLICIDCGCEVPWSIVRGTLTRADDL